MSRWAGLSLEPFHSGMSSPDLRRRHAVVVHHGPVRVVELVHGEARLQRVVEALVVLGLVHRLLDEQGRHGRDLADPARELDRALGQLVGREDLAHHAEPVALLGVDRVAGEHELLGLARTELPRVREVLDAAHPQTRAHDIGEDRALGRDDEVARPHQHEPGRVHRTVHLGDGDLAQVPPPQRVLEEVVPLLQHQALGARARRAVDQEGRVLVRPRHALLDGLRRAEVVPGREHRSVPAEDHDAHGVVGFGPEEGVVQLDQEPPVLRVAGLDAVQHDPGDHPVVERLVGDVLVVGRVGVGHAFPSIWCRHVRPSDPES